MKGETEQVVRGRRTSDRRGEGCGREEGKLKGRRIEEREKREMGRKKQCGSRFDSLCRRGGRMNEKMKK